MRAIPLTRWVAQPAVAFIGDCSVLRRQLPLRGKDAVFAICKEIISLTFRWGTSCFDNARYARNTAHAVGSATCGCFNWGLFRLATATHVEGQRRCLCNLQGNNFLDLSLGAIKRVTRKSFGVNMVNFGNFL